MSNICPFYSKQILPNVRWLTNEVQKSLPKMANDTGDYIMYWQNVTDYSLRDQTWKIQTQHQTGTYARGFTMESVYWFQNVMKFIHKTKTKTRAKIIQKWYQMHNYTPRMSDRPIQSMEIYAYDLLGNTYPLKVDRNLQWMSHHPTNPTYNPVLSGTMTQLSAWCLNITTRTHNTNTYTQKVCIRYLTYCMPPLW